MMGDLVTVLGALILGLLVMLLLGAAYATALLADYFIQRAGRWYDRRDERLRMQAWVRRRRGGP